MAERDPSHSLSSSLVVSNIHFGGACVSILLNLGIFKPLNGQLYTTEFSNR
eukprot:SAG31_NODE_13983_length_833_cov_1.460490_1_plen_50_part_10